MRKFFKILGGWSICLGIISSTFFTSCVTVDTRKITYFQSADTLPYQVLPPITPQVTRIQPDDILAVTVSSLSEESNVVFNFPNINALNTTVYPGGTGTGGQMRQPLGYLVDSLGRIEMPLVGKLKIAGMTLEQAGDSIKVRLLNYLKEPTVNVRYLNHKFTVIGEVARPSVLSLVDDHTSLPEALGMVGDLTIYGMRKNVMLIRTTKEKREVVRIDLTSRDFFNSPYYYLRNNDVIYVDVDKGKVTFTDQRVQRLQMVPIFTGIATTIVVILNLLK
jgi:polysaccharide export outer membrane protein